MGNQRRFRRSRLARKEEITNLRRAYLFLALTVVLVVGIIVLGIPLLIKAATFLGEIKNSGQIIEQKDILPPAPPRLFDYPQNNKEARVILKGNSEAGSKVKVYLNDVLAKEVIASQEGSFEAEIELNENENEVYFLAEDQAGNSSSQSEIFRIFFDNKPPELEITSPAGGQATTDQSKFEIVGKTEKDVTVTVGERLVILNQEGIFKTTVSLNEGENIFKVIAKDRAENTTEIEVKVTYSLI